MKVPQQKEDVLSYAVVGGFGREEMELLWGRGGFFFLSPSRRYIPSFSLPLAKSGRIKVRPGWWRMQQLFKVFAEFRGERERGFVAKGKERHMQKKNLQEKKKEKGKLHFFLLPAWKRNS